MVRSFVFGATLGLAACGGDALDVGEHEPDPAGTGSGDTPLHVPEPMPLPSWPPFDDCPSGSTAPFVGVWEGALEDEFFQPLMPLRIELTGEKPGGVCGTVTWGEGSSQPLDPATVSYIDVRKPAQGQIFGITAGGFRDNQLRFSFVPAEQWNGWCSQQPSFAGAASFGSCLPPSGSSVCSLVTERCTFTTEWGETIAMSLTGLELCKVQTGVCLCNTVSCIANPESPAVLFDLTLNGDVATGTQSGTFEEGAHVRLTRLP